MVKWMRAIDSDLISRKAVLNIIKNYDIEKYGANKYLYDLIYEMPSSKLDFDISTKIDKAYDDGYDAGYLQGRHDWGDWDE